MQTKLKSIMITRAYSYGSEPVRFNCSVSMENDYSETTLKLGHEMAARILEIVNEEAQLSIARTCEDAIDALRMPELPAIANAEEV